MRENRRPSFERMEATLLACPQCKRAVRCASACFSSSQTATNTCTSAPTAARPAAKQSRRRRHRESADRRDTSSPKPSNRDEVPVIHSYRWVQGSPLPKEVWNPGGFHVKSVIYPSLGRMPSRSRIARSRISRTLSIRSCDAVSPATARNAALTRRSAGPRISAASGSFA